MRERRKDSAYEQCDRREFEPKLMFNYKCFNFFHIAPINFFQQLKYGQYFLLLN